MKKLAMETGNLLDNIPADLPEELFTTILQANGIRIERIVSQGQASPPGFCLRLRKTCGVGCEIIPRQTGP